jgi:hypothetical protein
MILALLFSYKCAEKIELLIYFFVNLIALAEFSVFWAPIN